MRRLNAGSEQDPGAVAAAFAAAMQGFAPFERPPQLAVAVSGGADSVALCLLAADWARARGGGVTALIVDHDLRAGSAAEAEMVAAWMRRHGIPHQVLRWAGDKPAAGVQQAARAARFRLLCAWCRSAGVLHLLLGHHRRDQAETVLHRLLGGSGIDGLAGIAACVHVPGLRVLRPLLDVDPQQLRALLDTRAQRWLDDPANRDPRFSRARLRRLLDDTAAPLTSDVLTDAAAVMRTARRADEDAVARLAGGACRIHPAGFVAIDRRTLAAACPAVGMKLLANVVTAVGGREYRCSPERIGRAYGWLADAAARGGTTLSGCRISAQGDTLRVWRECRNLPPPQLLEQDAELLWDGRFLLRRTPHPWPSPGPVIVRPLQREDQAALVPVPGPPAATPPVPRAVQLTLPVICDARGPAVAPLLGLQRQDQGEHQPQVVEAAWRPRRGITGPGYFLA